MNTTTGIHQIKAELLSAIDKDELTDIKEKYGKETIKLVWQSLSDIEKAKIRLLCNQEQKIEQSILDLVKMVKQMESSIIDKMCQFDCRSIKDDSIKVNLRNYKGKNQLVVTHL